ncbi:MAG: hypothetical protein KDA96_02790 [Planctomycetaceae bacterium]|nr:hypothetical protein [Planctomycetaceae bacterium]
MFCSRLGQDRRRRHARRQKSVPRLVSLLEQRLLLSADFRLFKDVNTGTADVWLSPISATGKDGISYFSHYTHETGRELWRTDGTEDGTWMVKDIGPGPGLGVDFESPLLVGDTLYLFVLGRSETQLWRSDGTEAGTYAVFSAACVNPSFPTLQEVDGTIFFTITTDLEGTELWKTDGTEVGTELVLDIHPGSGSSSPEHLSNLNARVVFVADDGNDGRELWVSDGTDVGTTLLLDIEPGGDSNPRDLTVVNGSLFFTADDPTYGRALWVTDGTALGTERLTDVVPNVEDLVNVNGTLFFDGDDALYSSDGTIAGTTLVKDVNFGGNASLQYLTNVNGTLFFRANDNNYGNELWRSDGTDGGTFMVRDIESAEYSSNPEQLTEFNGNLYFLATTTANGRELWRTDGTAHGTVMVRDLVPGTETAFPLIFAPVLSNANGMLLISALDENREQTLWTLNDTGNGLNPVLQLMPGTNDSYISEMTNVSGTLFFQASTATSGSELWASDGTPEGTLLVREISHGATSSFPSSFTELNGQLAFGASSSIQGRELWITDGTTDGTQLIADIAPGAANSNPDQLVNVGGTLFFTADDGVSGNELWKSDGTEAGTMLVADISSGNSQITNLVNVNGTLFFAASDGISGLELWTSDGTELGTSMITEIRPGSASPAFGNFTVIGSLLYFTATNGTDGNELWVSDGTAGGTVMVKDINPSGSSDPQFLTDVGGLLYFRADDGTHGGELWVSDGTSGGTTLVTEIAAGSPSSGVSYLTNVGGTLYFVADDLASGAELWKSDGTAGGTQLVKDLVYGSGSSSPYNLRNIAGTLYFVALDADFNRNAWMSDGTEAGTEIITSTLGSSTYPVPWKFFEFLGKPWLIAQDDEYGSELYEVLLSADYGDADFSTLHTDGGARHVPEGIRLGALRDAETDGMPSATANGDDSDGQSDEDGVTISYLVSGTTGSITLDIQNESAFGFADAWIDFNQDGDFEGDGEQILYSESVTNGLRTFTFPVPADAMSGKTFVRVRVSEEGELASRGFAASGEVEDHLVTIREDVVFDMPQGNAGDNIVISRVNDNLNLSDGTTTHSWEFDFVNSLTINEAAGEADGVTIQYGSTPFSLPGGLTFYGDSVDDSLIVFGSDTSTMTLQEATSGVRTMMISDGAVSLTVQFSGVTAFQASALRYSRVNGSLNIGSTGMLIQSTTFFALGDSTTIDGGALTVSSGVALGAGKSVFASGSISAAYSGAEGSQIFATGDLTIGNAFSVGGFVSRGELYTDVNTVTLEDYNQAVLGTMTVLGDGYSTNGTVIAANGAIIDFGNNVVGRGTLSTPNDITKVLLVNGAIQGESPSNPITLPGYVKGVGTLDNVNLTGTYSPGLSPVVAWVGTVQYDASSRTILEIGGTSTGSFDQVNHSGTASLGGTLQLSLINGFVPDIGDSFSLMTAATIDGDFNALDLPPLPDAKVWVIDVSTTEVTATVVLGPPPTAPAITAPGSNTTSQRPTLNWSAVAGADDYEVWIGNQSTGVNPYLTATVAGTSYTPDSDLGIGRFNLWVRARNTAGNGPWTVQYNFTVETRASVHDPGRYLNTAQPALTWNSIPGAVKYDLWINDKVAGISQVIRDTNITGTTWTPSSDLPLGLYHAWIRGLAADGTPGVWSPAVTFYVMPSPNVTAGMNATFDRTPTFEWDALTGAVKYEVYISDRAVGTFPAYLYQKDIAATSFTPGSDMPDGLYRVWVIGVSAYNVRSYWTEPMDIYIGGRPEILTPTGSTSDTTPTFAWRTVDGADHYDLWVDQIGGTQQIIRELSLNSISFTPSSALPAGNYRMWVRAISTSSEVSPWSLQVNFTITATDAPGSAGFDDEIQGLIPQRLLPTVSGTDLRLVSLSLETQRVSERQHPDTRRPAGRRTAKHAEVVAAGTAIDSVGKPATGYDESTVSDAELTDQVLMDLFAVSTDKEAEIPLSPR